MEIPELTAPPSPYPSPEQWRSLRDLMLKRAGYRLQSSPREVVEDVVHDGIVQLVRVIQRVGMPNDLEAFAMRIVHCRCFDYIDRKRVRRNTVSIDDFAEVLADVRASQDLTDLEEETWRHARQVLRFFCGRTGPCCELAQARMRDQDFASFAAETGRSHRALLKAWSRCMQKVRDAIAGGDPDLRGLRGWNGEEA